MFKGELSVGFGLLVLLYVLFNPWGLFMPGYVIMCFVVAAIVLYIAFATFLWKESQGDEREQFHRLFADRIAYLAGSGTLLLGIVISEFNRKPSPWLILALSVMVIAKVVGLIYGKRKL